MLALSSGNGSRVPPSRCNHCMGWGGAGSNSQKDQYFKVKSREENNNRKLGQVQTLCVCHL